MDWSHEETVLIFKLRANGRNNSQHCWPLTGFNFAQQLPTTPNNKQQGVQTDVTCNIQQSHVRLHGALDKVLSVDDYSTTIFG